MSRPVRVLRASSRTSLVVVVSTALALSGYTYSSASLPEVPPPGVAIWESIGDSSVPDDGEESAFDPASIVERLALAGIAVFDETGGSAPQIAPAEPLSPLRLLSSHAGQLAHRAADLVGVSAADLDEMIPPEVVGAQDVEGGIEVRAPPRERADRYVLWRELLALANDRMHREDGERVDSGPLALAVRFARNQAIVRGALAPNLFEVTTAARGVHSDDYAWHVWDLANTYPHQAEPAELPTYRLTLEELERGARHLYFRRRVKTRRHVLRLVRSRKKEPAPGAWSAQGGHFICSYPPEDLRIEAYGAFLKKKARGMLSAEQTRVIPFSTSLCDGIDLRETIRNRAHDGRLFVREERPIKGSVGAVVVVFDEDRDERYPWTMTWQGENEQESDMALYATPPTIHVVGPGIGRAEYGGFLMTYPPGRMFRVFEDSYFDEAENKGERLLLAGIDYSVERWIIFVGKKPPRTRIARRARQMGKQVMYLPIGQLSPITLRELRVFHVLDGREVRGYAKEFI